MKKIFSNKYVRFSLLILLGFFIGWLFFHSPRKAVEKQVPIVQNDNAAVWTCAMHPQIRMTKPGKCPICGMDLIPLGRDTIENESSAIHFTKEAIQLANVLTSVVTRHKPVKEVRLYGKVQADERLVQSQVAHIAGRIDKLVVNFTGETVNKGQALALIYSPELITAQQELLEAAKTKTTEPEIYEAAKEKLHQWKLTGDQVAAIENSGKIQNTIEVVSNTGGIVSSRRVNIGDYVTRGTILYDIVDLSHVWVMFDAYESDLPFLKTGDKLSFTMQSLPGQTFTENITFIDPVIDPVTRVAKVRVEINNEAGKLKPEMFATGSVTANLDEYRDKLVIPRSAVLWTGKRSVVYVKLPGTEAFVFKMREVELGPALGNSYVINAGLNEGEEIVTQGTFNVDAAAQLEGKPSMMNPAEPAEKKVDGSTGSQETNSQKSVQQETFRVSGLCDLCKKRIEKAARSVKGVISAVWDVKTKKINVKFDSDETTLAAIHKAIAKSGHDTDLEKADDNVYKSLPECCHYRAE